MEHTKFKELWDASELREYYERMDALNKMGYAFETSGCSDMDFHESKALDEWLGEYRTIMDITLHECKAILPLIKSRAAVLRQKSDL